MLHLYNSTLERNLITLHNFDHTIVEIDRLRSRPSTISIQLIVDTLKTNLESALFGCEVDVGLYVDANQRVIEYYGDANYVRKVFKGESGAFRALENRESVVEKDSKHRMVVFIPLLGPTLGHGVLEIHGFVGEGGSGLKAHHRSGDVLRSMIASKDYSFVNKTRFWRKKKVDTLAGIPQSDSFIIVSGRVTEVMYTKNGVPYYGGPRFVMTWEDGKVEEGVSGQDLVNIFKESLQSLGGGTSFTPEINYHLTQIASDIGDLLESRKADIFVKELKAKLAVQQLNVVGMMELALQSVSIVLSQVKEIALMAFKQDTGETKALIQYNLDPQTKYGRQYTNTALAITQEMIDSDGDIVELIKADAYSTVWLGAEVAVPKGFLWGKSTFYDQYFMVVHKGKPYAGAEITSYDRKCFFGVLSSIEQAIHSFWMVEQTRRMYKEFIKTLEAKLFEWRAQSQVEICHNALDELLQILTADAYIGLIQRGGDQMRFIAATKLSKMEGKTLRKTEGISFDVVESLKSVLLEKKDMDKKKLLVIDAVVDVMYGKKAYKGKLVKIHGHDMYDIRYDIDNRVEAGVNIDRIFPMNKAFKMKSFGTVKLPVLIVPVRNRGKCIGVLGLDNFSMISGCPAPDDLHSNMTISHDLQVCLEQFGRVLGAALDAKAKKFALETVYIVGKNQYAEMHDLIRALFDAAFASSCYVSGIVFAETSINKNGHQSPTNIIAQEGDINSEVYKKIQSFERIKFGKRSVHKLSGSKSVWIICDLSNAKSHGSTVYFAVVTFSENIQDPDFEFMDVLQKALMTLIQSIITFRTGSEIRRDALATVKRLCATSNTYTGVMSVREPTRAQWFNQIVDTIGQCFAGTNMYAGLLGKFSNEINFILASSKSVMEGKQLRRREGGVNRNITFMAIDNEKSVCITANSPLAMSLQHFGSKQSFEFPFIVTPISAGIDSLIGVLSADGCGGHQSSAESEDQLADVIIFFQTVSNLIAQRMQLYRKEDFHRMLQHLVLEKSSLDDAYDEFESALLRYLPFSNRIVNLMYHPMIEYRSPAISLSQVANKSPVPPNVQSSGRRNVGVLSEELVLLISPLSFLMHEYHHSQLKKTSTMMSQLRYGNSTRYSLRISWLGETLCDMNPSDPADGADDIDVDLLDTYLAVCPPNVSLDTLSIVMQLMTSDKKVISRLSLPFHTLEHASCHDQILTLYDTTVTNIAEAEAAKVVLRYKLFASQAPVGLRINSIHVRSLFPPNFTEEMRSACQLYVVINWNAKSIGRSEYIAPTNSASEWLEIGAYLPLASYLPQNVLIFEFWIEKTRGKTHMLGSTAISLANYDMKYLQNTLQEYKANPFKVDVVEDISDSILGMTCIADISPLSIRQLREEERLTALHLQEDVTLYQEARIAPLKKQRSIRKDEDYMQVELGLIHAKYLVPDPDFVRKLVVTSPETKPSSWQPSSKSLRPGFLLESMKLRGGLTTTKESMDMSPTPSTIEQHQWNIFVYVTLDGVEVGTSSIITFNEDGSAEWKDEFMRLSLPVGESIDNSMLRLEVFITDDTMKQSLLGWVELQGESLSALFFSKTIRYKWLELSDCIFYQREFLDEMIIFPGLLLLSGRPVSSKAPSPHEKWKMPETKELQIDLNSINLDRVFMSTVLQKYKSRTDQEGTQGLPIPSMCIIYFNQRKLCSLELAPSQSPEDEKDPLTNVEGLLFTTFKKLIFLYPCNKTLFQSELKLEIQFRSGGTTGSVESPPILSACILTGSTLVKCFGMQGIVTREFHIPPSSSFLASLLAMKDGGGESSKSITSSSNKFRSSVKMSAESSPLPKISENMTADAKSLAMAAAAASADNDSTVAPVCDLQIRTGPREGIEIYEYDGKELFLDLIAAFNLQNQFPSYSKQETTRPNPYALVYWNEKQVGRTRVHIQQSMVLWQQERFVLKIPVFGSKDDRLSKCRLRIEVFNDKSKSLLDKESNLDSEGAFDLLQDDLLGLVEIVGSDLHKLFKEEIAVMRWFELTIPSLGETQKLTLNPNDITPFLKLRGSYSTMPNNDKVVEKTGPDYILQLLELKDLANTDAYGGANAVVEIVYNDLVVGFTNVARESVSPKYVSEQFYIVRNEKNRRENIQMKVWSLMEPLPGLKNSRKQFLGLVDLSRDRLDDFFDKVGEKQWFPLSSDPELTTQENALVKGRIAVELNLFSASTVLHGPLMAVDCILWIHSISHLPAIDTFDLHPASLLVIKRRYDKEGNQFEEIYRSNQLTETQHPRFDREFCLVKAPIVKDWSGFHILIEIINKREELVAIKHFEGNELKEILLRDNPKSIMNLVEFELVPAFGASSDECMAIHKGEQSILLVEDTKDSKRRAKIRIGGGLRVMFDSVKHTIKRPVTRTSASAPGSNESTKQGGMSRDSGVSSKSSKSLRASASFRSSRMSLRSTSAKKVFMKILNISGHKPQTSPVSKFICEAKVNGGISCGKRFFEWHSETGDIVVSGEGVFSMDAGSLENAVNGGVELVISSCLDNGEPIDVRGKVLINMDMLSKFKDHDWIAEVPIQLVHRTTKLSDDESDFGEEEDENNLDIRPEDHTDFTTDAKIEICFRLSPIFPEAKFASAHKKTVRKRGTDVMKFVLTLVEAGRFMMQDGKLPRNPEVYVKVAWGPSHLEVGKTQMYPFTVGTSIVFDAEHFELSSNMGDTLDDISLTISLHLKKDNRILAQKSIGKKEDFLAMIECGEAGMALNLSNVPDILSGPPFLTAKLFQFPKFDKYAMYNLKLPCSDEFMEIECTVLGAENLYKAKSLGATDAICIAYVGRHRALEIGKTSIFRDSVNPWWKENQTFRFRIPTNFSSIADTLAMVGIFGPKDLQFTLMVGHIQRNGKPLYLGEVTLSGEDFLQWFHVSSHNKNSKPISTKKVKLPLKGTNFVRKVDHKRVQGNVVMVFNKIQKNDISGRELEFHVLQAHNVHTDDFPLDNNGIDHASAGGGVLGFSGSGMKGPDTYVRLRWNGLIIGSTYVEKSSFKPVWEHEKFLARLSGQVKPEQASLTVELWQVHKSRQDVLIGGKEITGSDLKSLLESSHSFWVSLDALEEVPQALQTKAILQSKAKSDGTNTNVIKPEVEIRIISMHNEAADASLYERYELGLIRANNLAKIDGSEYNTSPYALCLWNDREIGRTSSIQKSISPNWSTACSNASATHKCYFLIEKANKEFADKSIRLEIWNHRKIRKGEFLGGVVLEKDELKTIFENKLNEPLRLKLKDILHEKSRARRFVQGEIIVILRKVNLDGSSISENVYDQELQLEMLSSYDNSAGSPMLELMLEQVYIRPALPAAGRPRHIGSSMVSFMSAPVIPSTFQPTCKIMWHDHTMDVLSSTSFARDLAGATIANMVQKPPRIFTVNIPKDAMQHQLSSSSNDINLIIEVWNELVDIKGNEIGYLSIPLSSLLRLYCGRFTFTLNTFDPHQAMLPWHASITFSIKLFYAQWNILKTHVPTIFKRRITILGGHNLPYVNGQPPNTRCHLMLDGVSVVKSSVVAGNRDPKYHRMTEEIDVNIAHKRELVIEVIYVDPRNRKEIIIGREEIPFESIIRPPKDTFEVFLGPSGQVYGQYTFALSGSVKVQITGSNRFDASFAPWAASAAIEAAKVLEYEHKLDEMPLQSETIEANSVLTDGSTRAEYIFSHQEKHNISQSHLSINGIPPNPFSVSKTDAFHSNEPFGTGLPLTNYIVDEENPGSIISTSAKSPTKTDSQDKADQKFLRHTYNLNELDRKWLGTLTTFSIPQEVPCRPEWLVLPITDLGVQVGTKKSNFFGVSPGTLMAFGIERNKARLAVSDATMLEDVHFEISACWVKLRWKDIYRKLREIALNLFKNTVEDILIQLQQDVTHEGNYKEYVRNEVYDALEMIIHHCLPGCQVTFIRPTADYCMVQYETKSALTGGSVANGTMRTKYLELHHDHSIRRNDKQDGNRQVSVKQIYPREYGQEMPLLGRNFQRSSVIASIADLIHMDTNTNIPVQPLALLTPFMDQSFPRFSVSLFAEDVTLALMQISGFDLYRGGSYNSFTNVLSKTDIAELQKWMESLGELAGDVIYRALERDSMTKIQSYLRHWNSTASGLLTVILEEVSQVLQGYRLMEIVTMDPEHHKLSSLQEKTPVSSHTIGKKITISSIRVYARRPDATNDDDSASLGSQSSMSSIELFGARHAQQVAEKAAAMINDVLPSWHGLKRVFGARGSIRSSFKTGGIIMGNESSKGLFGLGRSSPLDSGIIHDTKTSSAGFMRNNQQDLSDDDDETTVQPSLSMEQVLPNLILSLRYDGIEHAFRLLYDATEDAFHLPKLVQDSMVLYLKSDRRIQVHIYEVDDELHPVNEHSGIMHVSRHPNRHHQHKRPQPQQQIHYALSQGSSVQKPVVTPGQQSKVGLLPSVKNMQPFQTVPSGQLSNSLETQEVNEDGSMHLVLHPITPKNPVVYDLRYMIDMYDNGNSPFSGDHDEFDKEDGGGVRKKEQANAHRQNTILHYLESIGVVGIHLQIVQANNLKKMAKEALPCAFCEVYRGKKLIGSTSTVKSSVSPVWNHTMYISLEDLKHTPMAATVDKKTGIKSTQRDDQIVIEVYDMTFLRKGNFLGQVELPLDSFLTGEDVSSSMKLGNQSEKDISSLQQEEHALQMKPDMNKKKQAYVGGLLFIRHLLDKTNTADGTGEQGTGKTLKIKLQEQVPVQSLQVKPALNALKRIKNPVLKLTIQCAENLPVANRFTGTTDPYVNIFLGGTSSQEVIARTKVISEDLNPVWSETFTLPVISMGENVENAIDNFPTFRFEVFGHSKLTNPSFLGAAELSPIVYASLQERCLELTGKSVPTTEATSVAVTVASKSSKSAKSTKVEKKHIEKEKIGSMFAQGILHVTWVLEDTEKKDGENDGEDGIGYGDKIPDAFQYLSQFGKIDLAIVRATEVTVHKRVFGQWNPYVIIKYRSKKCGQSRIKSGTINPEYQERFVVYVDPQDTEEGLEDIELEIWHKDMNYLMAQDECLGVARISPVEYLHPSNSTQRYPIMYPVGYKSKGAADMDGEYHPGNVLVKLSFDMVRQSFPLLPVTHRTLHYPYQDVLTVQEAKKETSIMPMIMMYDPEEEKRRQEKEKITFPTLIRKTTAQTEKYENNPFTRTGLISETHYGQFVAAYRRGDRTTLRSSMMDMVCIPLFQRPANPFHGKKPTVIEEEKKKQANNNISYNDTGIMILPHYLACRYPSGQVPRRDIKFLEVMQRTLLPSLAEHQRRMQRREKLMKLVDNIRLMSTLQLSPSDLLMQAIMDLEVSTDAKVRLYVLDENGEEFLPISSADGKVIPWAAAALASKSDKQHHASNKPHHPSSPSSHSTTTTATQGKGRHHHIQLLARACRHDLVFQYYRGVLHVGKLQWLQQSLAGAGENKMDSGDVIDNKTDSKFIADNLHQLCLPIFDTTTPEMKISPSSLLSDIEANDHFAEELQEVFSRHFATGALVMPILGMQEHMIGVMIVKELDKAYPPAAYEYTEVTAEEKDDDVEIKKEVDNPESTESALPDKFDAQVDETKSMVPQVKRLEALEHGILPDLIRANDMLAVAVVQSRLFNMYRALKSFPVKADGVTPLLIIRYTLRMLCLAFPTIRDIGLWMVQWQEGFGVASRVAHLDHSSQSPRANNSTSQYQQQQRQNSRSNITLSAQPLSASRQDSISHMHHPQASFHRSRSGSRSRLLTDTRGNSNSRLSTNSHETPQNITHSKVSSTVKPAPPTNKSMGFFGRFFSLPIFAGKNNLKTETSVNMNRNNSNISGLSTSFSGSQDEGPTLVRPKALVANEANIICGVFGSEDPRYLMRTALERKLFSGQGNTGSNIGSANTSGNNTTASTPLGKHARGSHRRTHQQLEAMQRDLRILKQAEFTVTIPSYFLHPSHEQFYQQSRAVQSPTASSFALVDTSVENQTKTSRGLIPLDTALSKSTGDSHSGSADDFGQRSSVPALTPTASLLSSPTHRGMTVASPPSSTVPTASSKGKGMMKGFFSSNSAFQAVSNNNMVPFSQQASSSTFTSASNMYTAPSFRQAASVGTFTTIQSNPPQLQHPSPHSHRRKHSGSDHRQALGRHQGGPMDNGTYPGVSGVIFTSSMNLVQQEILRCVFVLKQQSFVLSTGHALTAMCATHRLELTSAPELDLFQWSFDRFANEKTLSSEAIAASKASTKMSSKKTGIAAAAIASITAETEFTVLQLLKEQVLFPALKPHVTVTAPPPMPAPQSLLSAANNARLSQAMLASGMSVKSRRLPIPAQHDANSVKFAVDVTTTAGSTSRRLPPLPPNSPPPIVTASDVITAATSQKDIDNNNNSSYSATGRRSAIMQPRPPPSTTTALPTISAAEKLDTLPENDIAIGATEEKGNEHQPLLFLSVNTHGLSGTSGWGTVGHSMLPILETVTAMLEVNLLKWQQTQETIREKQQLAAFIDQQKAQSQQKSSQKETLGDEDGQGTTDMAEVPRKHRRQLSMIPGGENEEEEEEEGQDKDLLFTDNDTAEQALAEEDYQSDSSSSSSDSDRDSGSEINGNVE